MRDEVGNRRQPAVWCCRCGLNARPLPYQGSALPLSYGSRRRPNSTPHGSKPSLCGAQHTGQMGSKVATARGASMDWTEQGQPEVAPVLTARRACGNTGRHFAAEREMWRPVRRCKGCRLSSAG